MVNEEIVTGLRNAIEQGDSLQNAMQIMMNSGYNPTEVQEASRFFGGGILNAHQPKPEEQLTMPNKKPGVLSRIRPGFKQPIQQPQTKFPNQTPQQPQTKQLNQQPIQQTQQPIQQIQQPMQQIQQPIQQIQQPMQQQPMQSMQPLRKDIQQPMQSLQSKQTTKPLTKQLQGINPKGKSHTKEIILVVILLVLIGVLITTILLKDTIVGWFA